MWREYFEQYLNCIFPLFLKEKPWNYKDDLCVIGANRLAEATGDSHWNEAVERNACYLMHPDGTVVNWKPGEHNIDKVSFGKSLRILRDLTGDERYENAVKQAYAILLDYPRTKTGNFWHKDIYPNQVWLDGLYMGMPFYAACLHENGEDRWDDIADQFLHAHELLWDPEKELYVHANDCSRAAEWADPHTGKSPCVWLRAEGWFLMALCDTYEIMKQHSSRASELTSLLQRATEGILHWQNPGNKLFYQLVDRADLEGNYVETSGSAMVAYAFMKGARLGMLDAACWQTGSEILDGIRDLYLRKECGEFHLYGICASAGLGPGPDNRTDRDGSPAYYLSEKQMPDNQHGSAACMMAYAEQLLIKQK